MGELTVVGEQEDAGRVGVQAADRNDACLVPDEFDDRGPPVRIARRRYDPSRLVEQHVGERLVRDRFPVDLDPVALRHERVQLSELTVDRHPAGLDQLVGAATGGVAGAGEVCVQSHNRIFGTCPRDRGSTPKSAAGRKPKRE